MGVTPITTPLGARSGLQFKGRWPGSLLPRAVP